MRRCVTRVWTWTWLGATLSAVLSTASFCQTATTGEITGSVTDATGARVAVASLVLKNAETGDTRSATSTASGLYRFTFVRPGTYEISGSSAGLSSAASRVVVALGQIAAVNLVVHIQAVKQELTVSDATPLLEVDNAHITYTVSARQLDRLPLPGGDLVAIAYSAPGIVLANRPSGDGGAFAAQGIGSVSNLFTFNGADYMDPFSNLNNAGVTGLLLGANEIQEAVIIQNAYDGHYGRQAGAQINYISKSGSNVFHGTLAYSYNGTFLNANDYFNNTLKVKRPHVVSNQYAASLGGPLMRNKLFFFADTEGLRYAIPGSSSIVAVPSKALEQYALNTVDASQQALYKKAFSLYDAAPDRGNAISVVNGNGLLQDSRNRLGCGSLNGTPTGFGGTFGTTVSCADVYMTFIPVQISEWLTSARLDYNISPRQRAFLRVKTDHGFLPQNTNAISSGFNIVSSQPDYDAQLSHTFAFTSRLTNNLIFGASYYSYIFSFTDQAGALSFPFRWQFPDGGANGGRIAPIGVSGQFPSGHRAVNLQLVDDVSYSVGNHWLTAGVNVRHSREADANFSAMSQVGRFQFARLTDFANGALAPGTNSFYVQFFPTAPIFHLSVHNSGWYVQDQWSVTPHLKLTAALRFEHNSNPSCDEECFARLSAPFPELVKSATTPYNQSIQGHQVHAFYGVDTVNVQPRFSFAYSPSWSQSTAIRGGVGLFSDLYQTQVAEQLAVNPPNLFGSQIKAGRVSTSGAGSAPGIAAASAAAFRNGFANGATLAQLQAAVAPATFQPPFIWSLPRALQTPKVLEWSAEVQQQIGKKNVASLRYAGNHGYHLFLLNGDVNAFADAATFPNGFGGLPSSAPDPRFATVEQITNAGTSNYNGLTASLRRTFAAGLQGQIAYTWSHALDTASNGGFSRFSFEAVSGQMNPFDPRPLDYSSSDYDIRHDLSLDFVWDSPARPHSRALNALLGGWSIANKTKAYSGTPFSVFNFTLAGTLVHLNDGLLAAVVDSRVSRDCGHSAIRAPCFDVTQFASTATQTTFGNVPRNSFRGPGYFDVDTALYKTIFTRESLRLTLGMNAFNLLNHPNLVAPNSDVSNSGFGLITSAGTPPSSPYGAYGSGQRLTGRVVVLTGKLLF